MRPLILLAAALLPGCGSPEPARLLADAIRIAATTPHRFAGTATRTVTSSPGSQPIAVQWEVTGEFQAPYMLVELDTKGMKRRTYGKAGWWVEKWTEMWRAYPPPQEAIEWLDVAELSGAAYGQEETVNGQPCRRVDARHPAGQLSFHISRRDGRILKAVGMVSVGQDAYAFALTFDWSGGKADPPPDALVVLDALAGKRPEGNDPAAMELAQKAWAAIPDAPLSVSTLQIDFAGGVEQRRRNGFLQQVPPVRASELAEGQARMYVFTDGVRALTAEALGGPTKETGKIPPVSAAEMWKVIQGAVFQGEVPYRGGNCRLIGVRLQTNDGRPDDSTAAGWLWISANGRLLRQVLVGKMGLPGDGAHELTTYVDLVFTHEPPTGAMIDQALRLFGR